MVNFLVKCLQPSGYLAKGRSWTENIYEAAMFESEAKAKKALVGAVGENYDGEKYKIVLTFTD